MCCDVEVSQYILAEDDLTLAVTVIVIATGIRR
jgi:hypothetical protein